MNNNGWYAAKLNQVDNRNSFVRLDSYTFLNQNSVIPVENYIERKNLKDKVYA
jgi:hypothetical protein